MLVNNTEAYPNSHTRSRSLQGVQLPIYVVGAIRGMLATQGISPNAISDTGEIDPSALMALAFSKVEIRSRLHDPIVIDMRTMQPGPGVTSKLLNEAQPAIYLHLRSGGTFKIAPAGEPTGGVFEWVKTAGWDLGFGVGAALLGLVALGYAIGGKRR